MNFLLFVHPSTAAVLGILISVVIPAVSSLLSRTHWDSFVTGLITLALATLNGFLVEWAHVGASFDWRGAVMAALSSYVIAVLVRMGLLKGTGFDGKLLAAGSAPHVSRHGATTAD